MCLFCKKIKEIKDLEVSDLKKSIEMWKRRDVHSRKLMRELLSRMLTRVSPDFPFDEEDMDICLKTVGFLETDWIGK